MKANRVLACMKRGFINLNESILLQLYKSMVQPTYIRIIMVISSGDPITY